MVELAFTHMVEIPRFRAAKHPQAVAYWFEGRETRFAELDQHSSQIANGLIDMGVPPGERVAFLGKNMDIYYEILFGVVKARGCMTGVNNRLAPPEIAYVIDDCQASVLFVAADFFDSIDQIRSDCPTLKHVIAIEGEHEGWPDYFDWRDRQSTEDPMLANEADDDVIQLYTSGTTGFPKGVQLSSENYMAFFRQAFPQGWAGYDEGDVALNCMPLFHVAGVNFGLLTAAQGAKAVILRDIDPQIILKLVEEHKVKHTFWVPAVILMLTQQPNVRDVDFSALQNVSYGASPIAEDLLKTAVEIMGCNFHQLYGLSETIGAGACLPPSAHDPAKGKLRACGLPWAGAEVRTVDGDGKPTGPGEVGEICIKAPFVMKGYWNRPEATEEAIRDGWFHTGDAGYFDDEGFLYIHDRVKDMIVSGGENVYPAEVENAIFSHPDVADVAVIGIPSERWGEEVKAIVVKAPGTDPRPEDIITFARTRIAAYKAPKSVDFVEALPRNPSGKILRKDLREPFWKHVERRVG